MMFVLIFMVEVKDLHVKLLFTSSYTFWPCTIHHVQLAYIMTLSLCMYMYVCMYVCMYLCLIAYQRMYVCIYLSMSYCISTSMLPCSTSYESKTSLLYLFIYYVTMVYTLVRKIFFVVSNHNFLGQPLAISYLEGFDDKYWVANFLLKRIGGPNRIAFT